MEKKYFNEKLGLEITAFVATDKSQWFKLSEVGEIIGYSCPRLTAKKHISKEYIKTSAELVHEGLFAPKFGGRPNKLFVNTEGLNSILSNKNIDMVKSWIKRKILELEEDLIDDFNVYNCISIQNEYDLHVKTVEFIRRFYPSATIIPGLGELQDTNEKRISLWKKGYKKGQPDILIPIPQNGYNGLCIEFKTPKGNGKLSNEQKEMIKKYAEYDFKCLVSNDYDYIIMMVMKYFHPV